MTKQNILVEHTKLTFNLVYSCLKGTFPQEALGFFMNVLRRKIE